MATANTRTAPPEPRWLGVKEAARYGRISVSQLYILIGRGVVSARKMGRKTLVDVATLDAYYASLPPLVLNRKISKSG